MTELIRIYEDFPPEKKGKTKFGCKKVKQPRRKAGYRKKLINLYKEYMETFAGPGIEFHHVRRVKFKSGTSIKSPDICLIPLPFDVHRGNKHYSGDNVGELELMKQHHVEFMKLYKEPVAKLLEQREQEQQAALA